MTATSAKWLTSSKQLQHVAQSERQHFTPKDVKLIDFILWHDDLQFFKHRSGSTYKWQSAKDCGTERANIRDQATDKSLISPWNRHIISRIALNLQRHITQPVGGWISKKEKKTKKLSASLSSRWRNLHFCPKIAPFVFCNKFVKPESVWTIFGIKDTDNWLTYSSHVRIAK